MSRSSVPWSRSAVLAIVLLYRLGDHKSSSPRLSRSGDFFQSPNASGYLTVPRTPSRAPGLMRQRSIQRQRPNTETRRNGGRFDGRREATRAAGSERKHERHPEFEAFVFPIRSSSARSACCAGRPVEPLFSVRLRYSVTPCFAVSSVTSPLRRCLPPSVDHSFHAIPQPGHVEVDQQGGRATASRRYVN